MIAQARPWLPAAALDAAAVERTLLGLFDGWASDWFAAGLNPAIREASPLAGTLDHWCGDESCAVGHDENTALVLGRALTGLVEAPQTRRDRALLRSAGSEAIRGLSDHLRAAAGCETLPKSGARQPAGLAEHIGSLPHLYRLSGESGWSLLIAVDATALTRMRRQAAGHRAAPPLATLREALDRQRISVGCSLGASRISAGELAGLNVGDVLVMPSALGDPLPIAVNRRAISRGRATLSADGARVTAHIVEPVGSHA